MAKRMEQKKNNESARPFSPDRKRNERNTQLASSMQPQKGGW
jgi:hypothetical protein